MKICADITLEKWSPNFSSSGQANPDWTRGRSDGVEFFNSLEWTNWSENPVQVTLCDACGHTGCASGGYVHISRVSDLLLWTRPQLVDDDDDWLATQQERADVLRRFGAIAIPAATWEMWRSATSLPSFSALSPANGTAILDAWYSRPGKTQNVAELVAMLKDRLLYCDSLEAGDAIARIERWIERLSSSTSAPGELRSPASMGARVETLYFNDWAEKGWPALAIQGDADYLLLDRDHAFVPGKLAESRA